MIPILFPADQTGFRENNGLGGLPDAISCVVTEQRNTAGGYWLEMDYPANGLHFDLLASERIIYAAPSMGNIPQPFRISRISRPINGIVHIEAPHISSALKTIVTSGIQTGTDIGTIGRAYFTRAEELGQTFRFGFASNVVAPSSITLDHREPASLMDVLLGTEGSILDLAGGEFEWYDWDVVLHAQRGVDSGLEIRYGVNMSDLEAETDATELVTACIPFWKGTVNEQDVVVVGDMCEADNADAYAYVRCVPLDVTEQFELEQDTQPTAAQVTAKGQAFINSTSRKLLQSSIRVSYEPTTSGIGERRINLCDTVRVVYPDLNVSSISRVVETKFNVLTERYDELTIGTIQNNIVDTIAGLISGGASFSAGGSGNVDGSAIGAVLYSMPQRLNEAQKAQARQNIGVGSGGEAVVNLPFVTPEDYGAVGDGVTNDTFAIQSALNSGSLVLCAEGSTYLVSSSLQISGGTILDMNESTFRTESDIPIIVENQNNSAVSKIVIRNGYFSGTRSDGDGSSFTNQCGIRIRSFQSVYDNLRFDNFNYGIYLDARSTGTGTLVENRILNCKFANCMNAAIYNETGTKVTDGILNNVKIGGTGYDYGVYLKQAGGWQISNLHIYGADFTIGAEFRNCDATLLSNVYIGGNHSTAGLILHDYSHVELSNAVIQANTARTNGLWAQTSTSQRWEKKPILLSNVVFSSTAAVGAEIFAIRGGGDIQTVNVIYNDQNGAFVDSRIEPTESDPTHVVKEAKVDEFGYDIYYPINGGKELGNNKDFDTIVEPGNYIVTKSAVAQSAINIPEVANGRLVVSNSVGVNGTNRYLRQEYRTYSTTNAIAYERYGTSSDNGTTWNWRPWVAVRDPLSTAVAINSGDNLNNYTNPGAFLVRTSQVAQNTANMPVVLPGRLFVMDMLNGYARSESSVYLRQFFIPYSTVSGTWTRYGVYSNGAWTWHEWQAEQRAPITVWEVSDVTQGLIALNTNISSSLAWQLTGLNLSPFKRIKVYAKAGRKTGTMAADTSIVPAAIIEMLLDDRAKETVSQNVFIGSAVVQNPNDANRLGMLTCAVSGDKTKFAVTRATSLYGTAATSNTDCYQYVFKIEGYYD